MSLRAYIRDIASAGATTIALKKLPVSKTDVLLTGETIAIEHVEGTVEYIVSGSYNSDSNGEISSVSITNPLTELGLTYAITSDHLVVGIPVQIPLRREITSDIRTAVAAESSSFVHFMEMQFSGGTQLLNTSVQNIPMMQPDLGYPKVDGGSQSGTALNTKDWIANSKVLRHGDVFSVDNVSYTVDTTTNKTTVDNCNSSVNWSYFEKTKDYINISSNTNYSEDVSGTSLKFIVSVGCPKRKLISYRNFSSTQDYSKYESVRFWIRTNVALQAGDFKLGFSTKKVGKNVIEYIPIPAMAANSSTVVEAEFFDETVMTSINSIGIIVFRDLPVETTIWIDNIKVYSKWVKTDSLGKATINLTSSLSPSPAADALLKRSWIGFGGNLGFEQIEESTDLKANRVTAVLSGVDQSIVSIILSQNYVGRYAKIYRGHFGSNYKLLSDPILMFWGYMNGGFEINEVRGEDGEGEKTVEIRMELQDRISSLERVKGIQTNSDSHQQFFPDDGFFDLVPEHMTKTIVWGEFDKPKGGGMCVLATACMKYKKLSDNCKELQILRKFRDDVLSKTKDGEKLIREYYRIVNHIVSEIEENERYDLYEKIYKDIEEAVKYIEVKDYNMAIKKYYEIIEPLKEEYL